MALTWLVGYVLAAGLLWGGISKRTTLRATSKQLATVVGGFILLFMVALTLDELFDWWSRFPKEVLGIIGILIVLERSVRLVQTRNRGGALLADLGRMPMQDMIINLFAGAGLAWIAALDIFGIVQTPHWSFKDLSLQVLGLSVSFAVLVQALCRRRLVEHGVFFGTGFSPWEQIKSYEWERESATSTMLVLHKRKSLPVLSFTTLSVKSELIGTVEEVLRQRSIPPAGAPPAPMP
jgi:hypothetical protein